jgi:hypothetical protein
VYQVCLFLASSVAWGGAKSLRQEKSVVLFLLVLYHAADNFQNCQSLLPLDNFEKNIPLLPDQ